MHYKLHGLDSKFAKMPRCNYKIHKSAGLTGEWKSNAESKGPTNCTDSCHKVIDPSRLSRDENRRRFGIKIDRFFASKRIHYRVNWAFLLKKRLTGLIAFDSTFSKQGLVTNWLLLDTYLRECQDLQGEGTSTSQRIPQMNQLKI